LIPPGPDKVKVLAARWAAGQQLHHPRDAKITDAMIVPTVPIRDTSDCRKRVGGLKDSRGRNYRGYVWWRNKRHYTGSFATARERDQANAAKLAELQAAEARQRAKKKKCKTPATALSKAGPRR